MAPATGAPPAHPELQALLGAERSAQLGALLLARAVAWSESVAPGAVHVDREPASVPPATPHLSDAQAPAPVSTGEGARMAAAAARLFDRCNGPILIAWPELARWRPEHAGGALDDLADGCDASFGPIFDGGFYLIALARALPDLLAAADDAWRGPEAMTTALGASHLSGLKAGLLRAERGLRSPGDVRAALADPLLDPELAAILHG